MKRLLIALVVNMVLFTSMSNPAQAASRSYVSVSFKTNLLKGYIVVDSAMENVIIVEGEHIDEPFEEAIVADDKDIPITAESDETIIAETDEIEIEIEETEEEHETEVQNAE